MRRHSEVSNGSALYSVNVLHLSKMQHGVSSGQQWLVETKVVTR
ncbi:hypothetical protein LRU_01056 [Ligilactobacillus ruminis SPM0211]|uniref:Uncharacterized protein n=1 Tax=Ligilactobacillus ruminis SPM0211 TaxID=1040964 RepID=F7R0G6_9LACO|nr:hypothetical protein LRU_01056 [Ligilactobacillus ruminis SPM0211]